MSALVEFVSSPRHQIRWWAFWTAAWAVLMPITLLTFLSTSIPWLQFMSLFANFASCGTALVAAWSYFRARSADEKIDSAEHFARIEEAEQRIERIETRILGALGRITDALVAEEPT